MLGSRPIHTWLGLLLVLVPFSRGTLAITPQVFQVCGTFWAMHSRKGPTWAPDGLGWPHAVIAGAAAVGLLHCAHQADLLPGPPPRRRPPSDGSPSEQAQRRAEKAAAYWEQVAREAAAAVGPPPLIALLSDDLLLLVLREVGRGAPDALSKCAAVNRRWCRLASDDSLWNPLLQLWFGLVEPTAPPPPVGANRPAGAPSGSDGSGGLYGLLGVPLAASPEELHAAYAKKLVEASRVERSGSAPDSAGSLVAGEGQGSRAAWRGWFAVTAQLHQVRQGCSDPQEVAWKERLLRTSAEAARGVRPRAPPDPADSNPVGSLQFPMGQPRMAESAAEQNLQAAPPMPVLCAATWAEVVGIWRVLVRWFGEHCPRAVKTLMPPIDLTEWANFVYQLQLTQWADSLAPYRLLLSVHNGQSLTLGNRNADGLPLFARQRNAEVFTGLLGGYSTEGGHLCCVRLVSLECSVHWTARFRQRPLLRVAGGREREGDVVFLPPSAFLIAMSFDLSKVFFCDAAEVDGKPPLRVLMVRFAGTGPNRGLPDALPELCVTPPDQTPTLLEWLGELAGRMDRDELEARPLVPANPESLGLCLLPVAGPRSWRAVRGGVEVVAGATCAAELDQVVCSVRLRITPGCLQSMHGFETCQLRGRRLMVRLTDGREVRDDGAGLDDRYPLLGDGGYRADEAKPSSTGSLTTRVQRGAHFVSGWFEHRLLLAWPAGSVAELSGDLLLVPGSLAEPAGEVFKVPLRLQLSSCPLIGF